MSDERALSCCEEQCTRAATTGRACPRCGVDGAGVELQTIKALLTTTALRRLEPVAYRFCHDPNCDIVY